jgi:hypothetical protein
LACLCRLHGRDPLLHVRSQLAPEPEEIEANQGAAVLDRMDLLVHARHHRITAMCTVCAIERHPSAERKPYFSSGISSAILIVLLRTARNDRASALAP